VTTRLRRDVGWGNHDHQVYHPSDSYRDIKAKHGPGPHGKLCGACASCRQAGQGLLTCAMCRGASWRAGWTACGKFVSRL